MPVLLPRSTWTSHGPVKALTRLAADQVKGVAVHYTGSTSPLGETASLALSCQRLEEERAFHTGAPPAGRGWSDVAYSVALDVEGRVFDCRGIEYRSAANGNVPVNMAYGAVTWLLGVGDTPTQAMVDAFRWWRETYWLAMYPHATAVVGHRDLYGTDCPGDPTYALIRAGALTQPYGGTPVTQPSQDQAVLDADVEETRYQVHAPGGQLVTRDQALAEVLASLARIEAALTKGTPVTLNADQIAQVAAAVGAKLPPVDMAALAHAVRAEFAAHPLT